MSSKNVCNTAINRKVRSLSFPIVFITEAYKAGKCHTLMMLRFSTTIEITDTPPDVGIYRK